MKAGFSIAKITPPLGTAMMGFADRDLAKGCDSIRDDIFVRALFCEHEARQVLIMSFDLCFLGREDADRLKGAIGRALRLRPDQILLNASHAHTSPAVGTWGYAEYRPADRLYLRAIELASVSAASAARDQAREATIWSGSGRSSIPMNRRRRWIDGTIQNRPNPAGSVCDHLPVCLFRDKQARPIALLFSVSAHPSIIAEHAISAEYPGAAMRELNDRLGAPVSMFLQGCAGDAKTRIAGAGRDTWINNDWGVVERVGTTIASEAEQLMSAGLQEVQPTIQTLLLEMRWPLVDPPGRAGLEEKARLELSWNQLLSKGELESLWARRQLEQLDKYGELAAEVSVLAQGVQLGRGLRLIGIEGEPVADHGKRILAAFPSGVTFPLGYTNGQAMYLPTTEMLTQGGYEVDSFWEYGYPAQLAPGMDEILANTITQFAAASM